PASSLNASIRTDSLGSSTLRYQSNHRQPGSARVAAVNSRVCSIQVSAYSGLTLNLALIKIIALLQSPQRADAVTNHPASPSAQRLAPVHISTQLALEQFAACIAGKRGIRHRNVLRNFEVREPFFT